MQEQEEATNPMAWLWATLEQRLGTNIATAIHQEYNARHRRYEKALEEQRTHRQAERELFLRSRAEQEEQGDAESKAREV